MRYVRLLNTRNDEDEDEDSMQVDSPSGLSEGDVTPEGVVFF